MLRARPLLERQLQHSLAVGQRARQGHAGLCAGQAAVAESLGVVGPDRDGAAIVVDGGIDIAAPFPGDAAVVVDVGIVRIEVEGVVIVLHRQVVLAAGLVGVGSADQGLDELRVELDGLGVVLDRVGQILLVEVGEATAVEGEGVVGVSAGSPRFRPRSLHRVVPASDAPRRGCHRRRKPGSATASLPDWIRVVQSSTIRSALAVAGGSMQAGPAGGVWAQASATGAPGQGGEERRRAPGPRGAFRFDFGSSRLHAPLRVVGRRWSRSSALPAAMSAAAWPRWRRGATQRGRGRTGVAEASFGPCFRAEL